MLILIILLTILAASLFYYFSIKPLSYWKDRGVKQGNPKWLFGDAWGTVIKTQSIADMVTMIYNQCPGTRYSGTYQFSLPSLVLRDPDLIKQITVKDFDHFTDHWSFIPENSDPILGNNLFSLKGKKWRDMRATLSPCFTSSKMRGIFVLISECSENFVQHFLKMGKEVVVVELKDTFTRFTNDVIATTAFGIKVDSLIEPNNQFYLMGKEATNFSGFWKNIKFFGYFIVPKLYGLLKITFFSKEVSTFFEDIVSDTLKTREEKGIVRPDMIHLLMEARKGVIDTGFSTAEESDLGESKLPMQLSDADITSQAMIFFIAGFESVSILMSFLAYELATNPEVQDKLREEVKSTLEECNGKLTYEALLKMKYMDMVVSEALRKWPSTVSVDRVCTKPYTIPAVTPDEKPLRLEKGSVLMLPIFGMHLDPKHYPNPERFDPERFSDENKGNIKPYTYFPFGLGPRNCIGSRFALLETKTVMFYILRYFELVPVEKSTIPLKISTKQLTMTAEGGFWFGLKRIKN